MRYTNVKYKIGDIVDGFEIIDKFKSNNNGKLVLKCQNCGNVIERGYPSKQSKYKCDCMKAPKPISRIVLITFEGKTQNMTEWAKETGISRGTISKRFKMGLPIEQVFKSTRKKEIDCKCCGKRFKPKRLDQKYCCYECSVNDRYGEEQRRAYHNFKGSNRLYRNGKPDRSVTLTKVYMRDMGICALCGKHIDFDCEVNSNDYPTIDHIIPISKGGLHTWDNVRLACRGCNIHRGNKERRLV